MQNLPIRLGLALCVTLAVTDAVRSAEQPAADQTVTVERSGRKITITEDESGITVTIVEDGKTTVIKADSALELREKSRMAHALYQRYLRRGRNRVGADVDAEILPGHVGGIEAAPLPAPVGAGQVVGPGQMAIGNGMTAGQLLEATKAMAAGNRLAWNNGFGATRSWGSSSTSSNVSFRDGGRSVSVSESNKTGITVSITENGKTDVVTARTPEELAQKSPEAFRLYQEARKRARVSVSAGGSANASANGGGNSTANSNGSAFGDAKADGLATGGGSAKADGGRTGVARRVLLRRLRNARTAEERARIVRMLQQLGQ